MFKKIKLNQNQLKIIACAAMLLDHIGAEIFPGELWLRIIGRLAMPLFAYFIWEGTKYTRKKLDYFLRIFILGVICVVAYLIYQGEFYGNILITFSMSILIVYTLKLLKAKWRKGKWYEKAGCAVLFGVAVGASYAVTKLVYIDYGFIGVMLPVVAELFDMTRGKEKIQQNSKKYIIQLLAYGAALLILAFDSSKSQFWGIATIPLLMLYGGERGKYRMKYFFYIFYPLHLLLVGAASMLIDMLK